MLGLFPIDWVTVIGTGVTMVGFAITIVQVYKTKGIAEEAKKSADQASSAVKMRLVLSDLSKCSVSLDEVKSHILNQHYEAALLRLNDVVAQLMQARPALQGTPGVDFRKVIPYLSGQKGIREDIKRQISQPSDQFDPLPTLRSLDIISDAVNGWVGRLMSTEDTDANS